MKLIDILNMISKGELKEGTKIKYNNTIYVCKDGNVFEPQKGWGLLECIYEENLNDELELIGPECKYGKCKKCGIDEIEPDHFTDGGKMAEKIEELNFDDCDCDELKDNNTIREIAYKLNEVINKVNAQTTVLLSQEKDIKELNEQLDY